MGSSFTKPRGLKYTDLAIYIDANCEKILNEGEYPEVENKVYEYLYHLVYALSFKAGFFHKNVAAYDDFALYAAADLYMTIIKKLKAYNNHECFRGNPILPIKSILNYIKATLYPLKVMYQRQFFLEVISSDVTPDTDKLKDDIYNSIQESNPFNSEMYECYSDAIDILPEIISSALKHTQFSTPSIMREKIENSILLTLLDQITLPNKIQKKIDKKKNKLQDSKQWEISIKFMKEHEKIGRPVRLWHLPAEYENFIRILVTAVKKELSKRLEFYIHGNDLSEEFIDDILDTAYATYGEDNTED